MAGVLIVGFWSVIASLFANSAKPQRINPPHWIWRIHKQVQPTRIPNRVFADEPSHPRIIVPIAVVVQPCLVVVVLALEPDRVVQALLFGRVRTVFKDFTPGFVVCAPDDLAILVGHFLRGAEVVAVVPTQYVDFRCDGFVGPQRVGFLAVVAAVVGLFEQADVAVPQGLGHGHEGAGFVEVVNGAAGVGLEQRRGVFPCQGVAVPAV